VKELPLERLERLQTRTDSQTRRTEPVIFAEVQVSRQFSMHVLEMPGTHQPTWHRWLEQAFGAIEDAGYDRLTLVVGDTQYQLSLIQGEP